MTPQEVADVLTDAGFTKDTFAVFVANALKPVQRAKLQEQIAAIQTTLAGQQATASQAINTLNAEIVALG